VVVYDDGTVPTEDTGGISEPNTFLTHILQFLETPQYPPWNLQLTRYLRTHLFPMHPDLRHAALLKSMDLPHHLKFDDRLPYREGVVLSSSPRNGSVIEVGIGQVLLPNEELQPYTRVTVDMSRVQEPSSTKDYLTNARVVPATQPTTKEGYYWGYTTRQATSLSAILSECTYPNGYDFVIGTSERGTPLQGKVASLPRFRHLLVVFGGQAGIEAAAENDKTLPLDGGDVAGLFDWWVNGVPGQGSRTIRTEEALWIVLGQLFAQVQIKGIK
jgi:methyltransferase